MLLANRMHANRHSPGVSQYLSPTFSDRYQKNLPSIRFVATAIHELLGHGTGKLFRETKQGTHNFDVASPPRSPLTNQPISSWYLPGQTWTSVFEDVATSVEECRAILMSAYLIDELSLLKGFGYTQRSEVTAKEFTYLSYAHLAVEGLRSLEHFDPKGMGWTQAHSQAYFAIFKHLLREGGGLFTVQFEPAENHLVVCVDERKIVSHGKPALGDMMCKLHVWRCTADVKPCRAFYSEVTAVEGEFEEWRRCVGGRPEKRWKFVQGNTVAEEGGVKVKEYEGSNRGVVQSWMERGV